MTGGALLLAAALSLALYNLRDDNRAGTEPQQALEILQQLPAAAEPLTERRQDAPAAPVVKNVPDYIRCPEMSMPTVKIEGREYIGVLSIPTIDISLPVLSRLSKSGLKAAPCRYVGSAYLDSMVIAAHNYKAHFGKLKELRIGDRLSFTDADGNIFYYEVGETEILAPDATEEMTDSDWDLTLFTCTLGGKNRVTVRCFRLNKQ